MYRFLSPSEITSLERQGCSAENWNDVKVKEPFSVERVKNVRFRGKIELGILTGKVQVEENIHKNSSVENCYIENCTVGDNVFLSNIGSLVNYRIGNHVAIENAGTIVVTRETTFGNGHEIDVLNEGGGRELPLFDKLSAQLAYLLVIFRHNQPLINKLKALVARYVETKKSTIGEIGEHACILHTQSIINVNVGPFTKIRSAKLLEEGTVTSNAAAPVFVGEGVVAKNFVILSGSEIHSSAILSSTFVGQGVQMGTQFSAENSAFFANCEGFHGEACSVFAGPYTVSHHKSTLLIAGMFSFYNAGSGTNQSNHMYKLGPVHQGIVGRGSKTGSFSYLLWPCYVGAFSVVMDKHAGNFDSSELPFSYLNVLNGKTVVTPAMNLFTVGTARDSKKWPRRDRRNDPEKLDLINYDLLNPFTVQKIMEGSDLLARLNESASKSQEFVTHKGVHIHRLLLRTSKRYYDLAINIYLTGSIVNRLKNLDSDSFSEIRRMLTPEIKPEPTEWMDISGMVTEKSGIDKLAESVIQNEIHTIEELLEAFRKIDKRYEEAGYAWSVAMLKQRNNLDIETISKQQLLDLLEIWKTNSVKFNNMILKDAEKEFDQHSRIGFGLGGNEQEKLDDFKAIRGDYESNAFVIEIQKESEEINFVFEKLKNKLLRLPD